jgi:glutathione S-transferase
MLPGISRNMTFSFTGLPPSHPIGVRLEAVAQKLLQLLEDRVAQSTWLADEEFTAADLLSVFGVTTMRLFWLFGLEKYPAILAWLKRVSEREAYRTAMEKRDPGFTPLLGAEAPESRN